MRRILRYENGRAVWSDNEPAVGRVQGFGGSAMGTFSGIVLSPSIRSDRDRERERLRSAKRKGERE